MNVLKDVTVQRFSDELKTGMTIHAGQIIMIDSDGNKTYMLNDDVVIYHVDEELLIVEYDDRLITISVEDVIDGLWEISNPKSQ